MSAAARSMQVFGIYLLGLGAILTVAPNALITLFLMPPTQEVWIRIVGLLVFALGFYYVMAAFAELREFFAWTVPGRGLLFVGLVAFAVTGMGAPALALFGTVDLAFACWTALALRREKTAPTASAALSR